MRLVDELKARGLIDQMTYPEELEKKLNDEKIVFYAGFDCTADSLTVGHYFLLTQMKRLQNAGHIPICLIGGGTTLVGDPSGRDEMRQLMGNDFIDHNAQRFESQLRRFLELDGTKGMVLNNRDWLTKLNFLDFVRDIGVHYNVNRMLTFDCYQNRMKDGLTFFEFSYMLMQGYDFLRLYRDHHCILQIGGSDQWSNMLGGYELVRKIEQDKVYCLTFPLLARADGVKMGKSMGGAVWLDEEKTSPYDLYQYFRNRDDSQIEQMLKALTFLPLEEIERIVKEEHINRQKEILAYEITKDIHGKEKADQAIETARSLFGGGNNLENMPSFELPKEEVKDGIGLLHLLTKSGLCSSNSEGRSLVQQGGISMDDEKIEDPRYQVSVEELEKGFILRKGKKKYLKIKLQS
ncbi:MAG: tyrosine--tRNA ligase [Tissierellia bacterium]|nr:tyrosine--tRNA ligase [Tissierellia bacterium]